MTEFLRHRCMTSNNVGCRELNMLFVLVVLFVPMIRCLFNEKKSEICDCLIFREISRIWRPEDLDLSLLHPMMKHD